MIKVITLDREYGSGGSAIAEKVAAARGWKLWDHDLTCEIAKLAKCERSAVARCEERRDSRNRFEQWASWSTSCTRDAAR